MSTCMHRQRPARKYPEHHDDDLCPLLLISCVRPRSLGMHDKLPCESEGEV